MSRHHHSHPDPDAPPAPIAVVELSARDLTLSGETFCPNPRAGMQVWNTHPRVFLNMREGQGRCPYCGTVYRLRPGEAIAPGH